MSQQGDATIMLYESSGWAWTAGLPKQLHNTLVGRQKTLPRPTYVSLGSEGRYFIKFAQGASEWVGPEAMTGVLEDRALTTKHGGVRSVAFGEGVDSYFLVFNDGWWDYAGGLYTLHPTPYTLHPTPSTLHPAPSTLNPQPSTLGLPHGLDSLMDSRSCRADLTCVSLGPGGEWFLQAQNGRSESPEEGFG